MAPAIMGAPDQPHLSAELTNSFCRTDPEIAKQFARATFLSDHRAQLPLLKAPTLIVQCHDDIIAPLSVGEYMKQQLPNGTLRVIDNVGHCPHLSSPGQCAEATDAFLAAEGL
jgi:sigma-B regulation protein RsbQ